MFCSILLYRNTLWLLKKPALSHLLPDCRNYDQISHHFEMRHCLDENMKILRLRLPFLCNAWNLLKLADFLRNWLKNPGNSGSEILKRVVDEENIIFTSVFYVVHLFFVELGAKNCEKSHLGNEKFSFCVYPCGYTVPSVQYCTEKWKNMRTYMYAGTVHCTVVHNIVLACVFCKCTLCNKYFSCLNISITLSTIKIFFYIYE